MAVFAATAGAQAGPAPRTASDKLTIDHAARTASYGRAAIKDGDQILSKRRVVEVVVENSNSALYDCLVGTTTTSTPEVHATLGFLKSLGPYLIEGAVMRAGRTFTLYGDLKAARDTAVPSADNADDVEIELRNIDSALFQPDGLHALFARTTFELDRMRALKPGEDLRLTQYHAFATPACVPDAANCSRLVHTSRLASALNRLGQLYSPLARAVKAKPKPSDRETELVEKSAAALADADGLLGLAYLVERMVQRTLNAKTTVACSQTITMSLFSGRDATITVSPNALSQTARTTTAEPYALKVNVRSDWLIRPTLGLAFLAVPDGEYAKFGTKAVNDTTHTIRTAGSVDARFTYGLTLATTWRFLDWRDANVPAAIYLPEFTINPTDDVKAVALGVGLSISRVKFGMGYAWTKHSVLANGQQLGTVLRDAEELSTRDGYGTRKFYWSVSLIGLPPFLP